MKFALLIVVFFSLPMGSYAVSEDDEINNAIMEVQKSLSSSEERTALQSASPEAKAVTQQVKSLAGDSANEQEIYELSASILGNFKGKSMPEIKKIIEAAQRNPEAFANTFTPEQRQKLKAVSERLPASQQRRP